MLPVTKKAEVDMLSVVSDQSLVRHYHQAGQVFAHADTYRVVFPGARETTLVVLKELVYWEAEVVRRGFRPWLLGVFRESYLDGNKLPDRLPRRGFGERVHHPAVEHWKDFS